MATRTEGRSSGKLARYQAKQTSAAPRNRPGGSAGEEPLTKGEFVRYCIGVAPFMLAERGDPLAPLVGLAQVLPAL